MWCDFRNVEILPSNQHLVVEPGLVRESDVTRSGLVSESKIHHAICRCLVTWVRVGCLQVGHIPNCVVSNELPVPIVVGRMLSRGVKMRISRDAFE